jgi:hypothetical protein
MLGGHCRSLPLLIVARPLDRRSGTHRRAPDAHRRSLPSSRRALVAHRYRALTAPHQDL